MKKRIRLMMVVCVGVALSACDYDKFPGEEIVVKDNVSFALDIQPILTSKCATCHNPTEAEPDLREGYAYESLKDGDGIVPGNAEESELVEMLEWQSKDGNNMPPDSPLTPIQIALIKKWINEGVRNN